MKKIFFQEDLPYRPPSAIGTDPFAIYLVVDNVTNVLKSDFYVYNGEREKATFRMMSWGSKVYDGPAGSGGSDGIVFNPSNNFRLAVFGTQVISQDGGGQPENQPRLFSTLPDGTLNQPAYSTTPVRFKRESKHIQLVKSPHSHNNNLNDDIK